MEEKYGRVFLLSPANVAGKRAKMLLNPKASFELARRLRTGDGVPLGEAFAFMSGLYFRGKLAYARAFVQAPDGCEGVLIITTNRGLVSADALVTPDELQAYSDVPIDARDERYTQPLLRDAVSLSASCACLNCFAWECRLGEICRSFAADLWQKVTFPKGIRGSRGYESRRDFAAQRNGESFTDSHSRGWRRAPG